MLTQYRDTIFRTGTTILLLICSVFVLSTLLLDGNLEIRRENYQLLIFGNKTDTVGLHGENRQDKIMETSSQQPTAVHRNSTTTFKDTPLPTTYTSTKPAENVSKSNLHIPLCAGTIVINPSDGGLGNQLFEYATLFATATRNGLAPHYRKGALYNSRIYNTFCNLSITELPCIENRSTSINLGSPGCCTYNSNLLNLNESRNYMLNGYGQSWKNFDDFRTELRNELKLCPRFESAASRFYEETITNLNLTTDSVVKVGIHIRRTDFVANKLHGYRTASKEWIAKAIKFVQARIQPSKTPVFFSIAVTIWIGHDWRS